MHIAKTKNIVTWKYISILMDSWCQFIFILELHKNVIIIELHEGYNECFTKTFNHFSDIFYLLCKTENIYTIKFFRAFMLSFLFCWALKICVKTQCSIAVESLGQCIWMDNSNISWTTNFYYIYLLSWKIHFLFIGP